MFCFLTGLHDIITLNFTRKTHIPFRGTYVIAPSYNILASYYNSASVRKVIELASVLSYYIIALSLACYTYTSSSSFRILINGSSLATRRWGISVHTAVAHGGTTTNAESVLPIGLLPPTLLPITGATIGITSVYATPTRGPSLTYGT